MHNNSIDTEFCCKVQLASNLKDRIQTWQQIWIEMETKDDHVTKKQQLKSCEGVIDQVVPNSATLILKLLPLKDKDSCVGDESGATEPASEAFGDTRNATTVAQRLKWYINFFTAIKTKTLKTHEF